MKSRTYILEMRTERGRWVRAYYPGGHKVNAFTDLDTLYDAVHDLAHEWRGLTSMCVLDREAADFPFTYRIKEQTIIERYL